MIPTSLAEAEQELRRVIERRQAGDVTQCLNTYREIAGFQIGLLPDDPARSQIRERVFAVLEWARCMLQTQRAACVDEMWLLDRADRFLGAEPCVSPQLRLDI